MPSLVYISEDSQRLKFPLGKATLMIGRGEGAQVHLPDEKVSSNHASIIYEDGQFILKDNGSTNGSYVNGAQVSRQVLQHQDLVRFGEYVFMVDLEDQASAEQGRPPQGDLKVETKMEEVFIARTDGDRRTQVEFHPKAEAEAPASVHLSVPTDQEVTLTPSGRLIQPKLKIMLTQPIPPQTPRFHFAQFSWVCGLLGPLGFMPAIIFGHLAKNIPPGLKKKRRFGLLLGYFYLVLWCIVGYVLWGNVAYEWAVVKLGWRANNSQIVAKVPRVTSPLSLLQGPVMWCPPRAVYRKGFGPVTPDGSGVPPDVWKKIRAVWLEGLIVYEPEILRATIAPDKKTVRFVFEDCLTNPTAGDYNSTVMPEKKNLVGPFFISNLGPMLFFDHDQNLATGIAKIGSKEFPWACAFRGAELSMDKIPAGAQAEPRLLGLGVIVKPAENTQRLFVVTRDAQLLREEVTYKYNVYPTEYLGVFVYDKTNKALVSLHLNETLFKPEEAVAAQKLIADSFDIIMKERPPSSQNVGDIFNLGKDKVKTAK